VIACLENGYNVNFLKTVVLSAKIYIRPLQKSLSIEVEKEEVNSSCNFFVA
jgi:hypothetical protein